jgi:hypothetical protein
VEEALQIFEELMEIINWQVMTGKIFPVNWHPEYSKYQAV